MKYYLLLFLITMGLSSIEAQGDIGKITTYYLIRHAEKDRADNSNNNPNLTKKGIRRAENWRTVFKDIDFDFIFSTNYNRTIQTAGPTAKSKNLNIQFYNPKELYSVEFQEKTKGKKVLIVGHSNTTPLFANKILDQKKYPLINDNNNSNLYIVTIIGNVINDILLKIEN